MIQLHHGDNLIIVFGTLNDLSIIKSFESSQTVDDYHFSHREGHVL